MEDEKLSAKDYLISYIDDSPGIHRITKNYADYVRTPIGNLWKSAFGSSPADSEAEAWLNIRKRGLSNLRATELTKNIAKESFYLSGDKDKNGNWTEYPTVHINTNDTFKSKSGLTQQLDEVEGHEFSHASLPMFWWDGFGRNDMHKYYNKNGGPENDTEMDYEKYDIKHDANHKERQADKDGVRYLLYKLGIYDSRGTTDVTKEQIQQLRKWAKDNNYYIRMLEQSDDDQVVWLLNHIAKAPSKPQTTFYAKAGGKLNYLNYFK